MSTIAPSPSPTCSFTSAIAVWLTFGPESVTSRNERTARRSAPEPGGRPLETTYRSRSKLLHRDRCTIDEAGGLSGLEVTTPLRRVSKYEILKPQIAAMANAGWGINLISQAIGIGAEVVRNALRLHRTG